MATWPALDASTDDTWPTANDLLEWLRVDGVHSTDDEVVTDSFRAADALIRDRIDPVLLAAKAAKAGIQTDADEDDYDAATLEVWCPAYVRQAILIRAARIYTRRDSKNGTISFGEFATRVAKMDPDVDELLGPVTAMGIA